MKEMKPLISLLFIVITLFSLVFIQMEERRLGYQVLKLTQEHKKVIETKRIKTSNLAKMTRPQLIERTAQNQFTLKKVQTSQVIHLNSASVASYKTVIEKNSFNLNRNSTATSDAASVLGTGNGINKPVNDL